MTMTRRYTKADEKRMAAEVDAPKTPQEELTIALRDYLYDMFRHKPEGPCRWVMSWEWWTEVRRIESYAYRPRLWGPPLDPNAVMTLLGIPVEIRNGAGAPDIEAAP